MQNIFYHAIKGYQSHNPKTYARTLQFMYRVMEEIRKGRTTISQGIAHLSRRQPPTTNDTSQTTLDILDIWIWHSHTDIIQHPYWKHRRDRLDPPTFLSHHSCPPTSRLQRQYTTTTHQHLQWFSLNRHINYSHLIFRDTNSTHRTCP